MRPQSTSLRWLLRMPVLLAITTLLLCSSCVSGQNSPIVTVGQGTTDPPASSGTSSNNDKYTETLNTFVEAYEATRHDYPIVPLKLSLWTTPNRDWAENRVLMNLKAIAVRFDLNLINFHPHMYIDDGEEIGCRSQNNHYGSNQPPDMTPECMAKCQNMGRYCNHEFPELNDQAHAALTGAQIVAESARRLCMWITYGTANGDRSHILYLWDYVARLRESRCDMSLTDECIDQVYNAVGIESNKMTNCFHHSGGLGPEVDFKNQILGEEMFRSKHINASIETLPRLAVDGQWITDVPLEPYFILKAVCDAFPKSQPQLKVCGFCAHYCPVTKNNYESDFVRQCLWEMKCDGETFDDWVANGMPNATAVAPDHIPLHSLDQMTTPAPSNTATETPSSEGSETMMGGDNGIMSGVMMGVNNTGMTTMPPGPMMGGNVTMMPTTNAPGASTGHTMAPNHTLSNSSGSPASFAPSSSQSNTLPPLPNSNATGLPEGFFKPNANATGSTPAPSIVPPGGSHFGNENSPTHAPHHFTTHAPHSAVSHLGSANKSNGDDSETSFRMVMLFLIVAVGGVAAALFGLKIWRDRHSGSYGSIVVSAKKAGDSGGLAGTASHVVGPGDLELQESTGVELQSYNAPEGYSNADAGATNGGYYAPPSSRSGGGLPSFS